MQYLLTEKELKEIKEKEGYVEENKFIRQNWINIETQAILRSLTGHVCIHDFNGKEKEHYDKLSEETTGHLPFGHNNKLETCDECPIYKIWRTLYVKVMKDWYDNDKIISIVKGTSFGEYCYKGHDHEGEDITRFEDGNKRGFLK
jgi:hypothetical protein